MYYCIAIYEDNLPFARWMEKEIRYQLNSPSSINTNDKAEIQHYIRQSNVPTLYLLDIVDESHDHRATGIDLAREVIEHDRDDLIVFVTAYVDRILTNTALKGDIFNFIPKRKDTLRQELSQVLTLAGERFSRTCLLISDKLNDVQIPYKEINYIETVPRGYGKVRITGQYGVYVIKSTLKGIMPKLDSRFTYAHQSYIVNTANIRRIDKSQHLIYFSDSTYCPYSRLWSGSNVLY